MCSSARRRTDGTQASGRPDQEEKPQYEKYKHGELVVVAPHAKVYQSPAPTPTTAPRSREEHLKDIDRAPLLTVTPAENVMRRYGVHRQEERERERARQREEAREEAAEKHWPAKPPQAKPYSRRTEKPVMVLKTKQIQQLRRS